MSTQRESSSWTRRRSFLTALVVVVCVAVGAGPAGAAKPQPGVFTVKAGYIVGFDNLAISGCNQLLGGVIWDDMSTDTLASLPGGDPCFDAPGGPVFGPFTTTRTFRLFLQDVSCGRTYYSDGTSTGGVSSNHATIVKRDQVSFADGGFVGDGCQRADQDVSLAPGDFNFQVTVNVSRPPRTR
jgi:hypothetical protein